MKKVMLFILGAVFSMGIMSCDNCYNRNGNGKRNYRNNKCDNKKCYPTKEKRDDRRYKIERGEDW